jgi:hypothetical protein
MRTRFPQSLNNFAANPLLLVIAVWKDSTRSLGFRDWPDAPVALHAFTSVDVEFNPDLLG